MSWLGSQYLPTLRRRRPVSQTDGPYASLPTIGTAKAFDAAMQRLEHGESKLRQRVCQLLFGVVLLVVLVYIGSSVVSLAAPAPPPRPKRPPLDLANPSHMITCSQLEVGVAKIDAFPVVFRDLRTAAEKYLADDRAPCVCGPMVGFPIRVIGYRTGIETRLLYNPSVHAEGDRMVRVHEDQSELFPNETKAVENVRYKSVVLRGLHFLNKACERNSVVFHGSTAICAQICYDLLDGTSVYAKSRRS